MTTAAALPRASFLLKGSAPRYRFRTAEGQVDKSALAMIHKLVGTAPGLAPTARARLEKATARVLKAFESQGPGTFAGIPIVVEFPAGSTRSGVGSDGTPWSCVMQAAYGFLLDTIAPDDEELDAYLGPDEAAPFAWVVQQLDQGGAPDELKLLLGFASAEAAQSCYLAHTPPKYFGGIYGVPMGLVRGLLALESCEQGILLKSLSTAISAPSALAVVTKSGTLIGRIAMVPTWKAAEGATFLEHARAWVTSRGLLDPDSDYDGELGKAVLRMAEIFSGEGHSHTSAKFARAYFNWLCDGWDGMLTMMLDDQDHAKAVAALSKTLKLLVASVIEKTAVVLPTESVGYFIAPDASAVEPTNNACPICSSAWTSDDVRTYSLMALEGPASGLSLFYRTHRTCAEAASEDVIDALDAQAMAHAAAGRLPGQRAWEAVVLAKVHKAFVNGSRVRKAGRWVQKAVLTYRQKSALDAARAWSGEAIPLASAPDLADHPARTAPLSDTYPDPADVGGWLGWIEPEDGSWIAFVGIDGRGLLWTARAEDGAVEGTPFVFERPDLATMTAAAFEAAKAERLPGVLRKAHVVRFFPVQKGSPEASKHLIYGIVLEPEPNQGAGDAHGETYAADIVEAGAHGYLLFHRNMTDCHGQFFAPTQCAPVESFLAPCDYVHEGTHIRKGTWVLVTKVFDENVWRRVESGELTAYSIGGYAERHANL